jgi:hypothetical protein
MARRAEKRRGLWPPRHGERTRSWGLGFMCTLGGFLTSSGAAACALRDGLHDALWMNSGSNLIFAMAMPNPRVPRLVIAFFKVTFEKNNTVWGMSFTVTIA